MTTLLHKRTTAPRAALLAAVALTVAGSVVAPTAATPQSAVEGDDERLGQDSPVLDQTAAGLLNDGEAVEDLTVVAVDHDNQLVHHAYHRPAGDDWLLAAFDLRTLRPVGESQLLSGDATPGPPVAFFDSSGGRIFVHSSSGAVDTFYRWDPVAQNYVPEATQPLPLASAGALWDPIGERAVSLEHRPVPVDQASDAEVDADDVPGDVPGDVPSHEWYLHVHAEAEPGVWTDEVYPLHAPGESGPATYPSSFDTPGPLPGAVLADGSILLAGEAGSGSGGSEAVPPQRLLVGPENATVTEVATGGVDSGRRWTDVHTNAAGDVALVSSDGASVLNLGLDADGSLSARGEPVDVGLAGQAGVALDPVDGTTWLGGAGSQELVAVRDGEVVYRGSHSSLHPDKGVVAVGDDQAVYAVTTEDEPSPGGAGHVYGIGRFELASLTPPDTGPPDEEEGIEDEPEPSRPAPDDELPGEPSGSTGAAPGGDGLAEGGGGSNPEDEEQGRGFWWAPGALLGLEPGELVWRTAAAQHEIAFGTAEDRGEVWYATGELLPVTVTDTRAGGPPWSLSGGLDDPDGHLSGEHLGWAPQLLSPGAGAVAGDALAPGPDPGPGLAGPSVLASSPGGHDPGSATVGAVVELWLPKDTPAGTYTATLTVTALS